MRPSQAKTEAAMPDSGAHNAPREPRAHWLAHQAGNAAASPMTASRASAEPAAAAGAGPDPQQQEDAAADPSAPAAKRRRKAAAQHMQQQPEQAQAEPQPTDTQPEADPQQQTSPAGAALWVVSSQRAAAAVEDPVADSFPRKGSAYRGVTQHRRSKRWEAHMWINARQVYLGSFPSAREAAVAHDLTAIRFFGGRQALTNFVKATYEPELAAMESQGCDEDPGTLTTQEQLMKWREVLHGRASSRLAAAAAASTPSQSPDDTNSLQVQSLPPNPGASCQLAAPQPVAGKRRRVVSNKLIDALQSSDGVSIKQLAGLLPAELQPTPATTAEPPPSWGQRMPRTRRLHFPAGCSRHLISSLAGQNGQTALRAAGLTEQYRQRLEAALQAHAAADAGAAAMRGQHGAGTVAGGGGYAGDVEAAMCSLQAAAAAASAAAAVKLQQQQQWLLQERQQQQQQQRQRRQRQKHAPSGNEEEEEEEEQGVQEPQGAEPAAAGAAAPFGADLAGMAAMMAAVAEAEQEDAAAAAAAAAAAGPAESEVPQPAGGDTNSAVFQAMHAVLLQLESHSFGLKACLTEISLNWADAWKLGLAAAAAAGAEAPNSAGSAGSGAVAAAVPAPDQQQQQYNMAVQQLVDRSLRQQVHAEQTLQRMREVIAPFLPYAAAGLSIPDRVGDVAASVCMLQELHRQHSSMLGVTATSLKQLRAALAAALSRLQGSVAGSGQEAAGGGLAVLAVECGRALQAAWDNVVSCMQLVGLSTPS